MSVRSSGLFLLFLALGSLPVCYAQTPPPVMGPTPARSDTNSPPSDPRGTQSQGWIRGTVTDRSGALVAGAQVELSHGNHATVASSQSGSNGQFSFSGIASGPFELTISSSGFGTQAVPGILHPGETFVAPTVVLTVATAVTEVNVALSPVQVAEEQIKDQEKQRVLGVIPNFYVTYDPDPVPLDSKQKFKLAWKITVDPVSFAITGAIAGVQQAQNSFGGYGQGAQGYAKRFGASYADFVSGTFIGSAILPSLLKQDPRYFYKGTGTKQSRMLYALANAGICKGDNRRWQPNYSSVLGSFAAGGISNLYYPAENRKGAGLTIENGLIGVGVTAAANVLQEFVVKRVTSNVPHEEPAKP